MLFPLFLSSTAEEDRYTSAQQADSPRDPAVAPNLPAPPRLRARAQVKDAAAPAVGPDAGLRPRPEGEVFAEARTAVWTETEAGAGGKVFAEAGFTTETHAWAEAGWRPVAAEEGAPGDPAPMLEQEQGGAVRGEEEDVSSVLTALTEMVELQAPAVRKPLGLLSKAAWTKTLSSSSKAGSSSTTKASSVASSSSSSSPPSLAAASANVSVVLGNNNSSDNNSFGTYLFFIHNEIRYFVTQ